MLLEVTMSVPLGRKEIVIYLFLLLLCCSRLKGQLEKSSGPQLCATCALELQAPPRPPQALAGNDLKGARKRGQELPGSGNTLFLGLGASDVGLFTL